MILMVVTNKTSTEQNDDDNKESPEIESIHEIKVRRSDDTTTVFDANRIIQSLKKETILAEKLFKIPRINARVARDIANIVQQRIQSIYRGDALITAAFIRELVCNELLNRSLTDPNYLTYNKIYSRVGVPFYEVWNDIWQYDLFEKNENANLNNGNPENIHKKLADQVVKEAVPIGFPVGIEKAHYSGDIHVHQLEYIQRPFCADYDLRYFLKNGLLADGSGQYSSATDPANNAATAILHAVKVLAAGQCNCQGGQGLFNFNIFIAPFLEGMPYDSKDAGEWKTGYKPVTIKQCAQMFIFELNLTYVSRGGQLIFSSVQIEPTVPKLWADKPVVYKGKVNDDLSYGDFEREAQLFALALLEVYLKGDRFGKMFFFPKPELRLRKEHFTNPSELTNQIIMKAVELSLKFGSTYYDSVIPEYRDADGQDCYQCCAYHFSEDAKTLYPKLIYEGGQHFSMSGQQVVTLNLPRLAYRSKGNYDQFTDLLEEQMDNSRRFLMWKRQNVIDFAERGNLPFLMQRPLDDRTQPSLYDIYSASLITGFVGMNETVQAMTGYQLHEDNSAVEMGLQIVAEMERIKNEYAEETGLNFAVARTPAESTSQLFAILDLLKFNGEAKQYVKGDVSNWKHIYENGGRTKVPVYYTNGFMTNHSAKIPMHQKIAIEERCFPMLSGGNICNIFLGEKSPDLEAIYNLVRDIAMNTLVGYFSLTKDLTMCNICHNRDDGIVDHCTLCKSTNVTSYSRITGYVQAVDGWNAGKKQELKDRYRYQGDDVERLNNDDE